MTVKIHTAVIISAPNEFEYPGGGKLLAVVVHQPIVQDRDGTHGWCCQPALAFPQK